MQKSTFPAKMVFSAPEKEIKGTRSADFVDENFVDEEFDTRYIYASPKPPYVPSLASPIMVKQSQDEPVYNAVLSSTAAKLNLKARLHSVTLANVLSGDTCDPIRSTYR
jgi:hypothetical protein